MSKATRRLKGRGSHGRRSGGWRVAEIAWSDQAAGAGVVVPSPQEVLRAIGDLPPSLDWESVRAHVIPLFERVRPYPPGMPERAVAIVAPGVTIGFGVDVGPAFITVSPEMVEGWSMSIGDLAAHALGRLHTLAAKIHQGDIHVGPISEVEVRALQTGYGIGSALVLAPTELARLFGREPRVFIAPMRDLLIGVAADVDPAFCAWLFDEIASQDPNCLAPRAFMFDGRTVTVHPLAPPALVA